MTEFLFVYGPLGNRKQLAMWRFFEELQSYTENKIRKMKTTYYLGTSIVLSIKWAGMVEIKYITSNIMMNHIMVSFIMLLLLADSK